MGMFDGKKGLVFGIANDHSIAWAITQKLHAEGAEMGFTHLPDKDPERPRMERRLRKLVEPLGREADSSLRRAARRRPRPHLHRDSRKFGNVDFVLHSIAYAPIEDLQGPTYNVSRDGFKTAMEISVYSLLTIARRSRDILKPGGSILTFTYLGGEKVIPGYNIMGICKSASGKLGRVPGQRTGPVGLPHQCAERRPAQDAQFVGRGRIRSDAQALYDVFTTAAKHHRRGSGQHGRLPVKRSGFRRDRARRCTSTRVTTSWEPRPARCTGSSSAANG